jgi:hypothetical protein
MNHYNAAHVWGRIVGTPSTKKSKEGKGAPYLRLEVSCYHPRFGNVRAYGNLWGQKKISGLLDEFRMNQRALFKFDGFVSQYEDGEGKRFTNFTFIDWQPATADAEPRAAFILVGEVEGIAGDRLTLFLKRPKRGSEDEHVEERFAFHLAEDGGLNGAMVGDLVKVKGYLRAAAGEDPFGENTSPIRPYVEHIEVKQAAKSGAAF